MAAYGLGGRQVGLDHFLNQRVELGGCAPAKNLCGFGWISEEVMHLGRPEIAWIDPDQLMRVSLRKEDRVIIHCAMQDV